jgi:hypothetical protein
MTLLATDSRLSVAAPVNLTHRSVPATIPALKQRISHLYQDLLAALGDQAGMLGDDTAERLQTLAGQVYHSLLRQVDDSRQTYAMGIVGELADSLPGLGVCPAGVAWIEAGLGLGEPISTNGLFMWS